MSQRDVDSVIAELGTGSRVHQGTALLRRIRRANVGRISSVPADGHEAALRRRARRQGLLLMIGSSGVSILLLYGLWSVLRSAV